ncbi:hypothetical protein GGX14DRAFT_565729 [Mycena pura]|uniref:Uncharacterized protein n=1 Tax=Mycena pura TaxID=153505 RepID=A0AAD6VEL0_9AGAR|nr:hypothetical protein GGX14DRAFT_565729 [Mycena pura]
MASRKTRKKRVKTRNTTPQPQPAEPALQASDSGDLGLSDTELAQKSPQTTETLVDDASMLPANPNDSDIDDLGENFSRLASSDIEHSSSDSGDDGDDSSQDIELVKPRDSSSIKIKIPPRPATAVPKILAVEYKPPIDVPHTPFIVSHFLCHLWLPPAEPALQASDSGDLGLSDTELAQKSPQTTETLVDDASMLPANPNDSDIDDLGENFSRLASSDIEHSSSDSGDDGDDSSQDIELVKPRDSSSIKIKIPPRPATPTPTKPLEIQFSPAKKATKRSKGATTQSTAKKQRVDKPHQVHDSDSDSDSDLPLTISLSDVIKERGSKKPAVPSSEPVVKRKVGRPRKEKVNEPVELSAHVYVAYAWAVLRHVGRGTTRRTETEQKMSPLQGPFSITTFLPINHDALVESIAETMHIMPAAVDIASLRWSVVKGNKPGAGYPLYDDKGLEVMRESLPMVSQGSPAMHFQITLKRPEGVSAVEALGEAEVTTEEPVTKLDTLLGGKKTIDERLGVIRPRIEEAFKFGGPFHCGDPLHFDACTKHPHNDLHFAMDAERITLVASQALRSNSENYRAMLPLGSRAFKPEQARNFKTANRSPAAASPGPSPMVPGMEMMFNPLMMAAMQAQMQMQQQMWMQNFMPSFGAMGPSFNPSGPFGAAGQSFAAMGQSFGTSGGVGPSFGATGSSFGAAGPSFGAAGPSFVPSATQQHRFAHQSSPMTPLRPPSFPENPLSTPSAAGRSGISGDERSSSPDNTSENRGFEHNLFSI